MKRVMWEPRPSINEGIWIVWEIVREDRRNGIESTVEMRRPVCPATREDALLIAQALNLLQTARDLPNDDARILL